MLENIPREVRGSIARFLAELSRVVRVEAVYLFGSYAKGDWIKTSDVDLVVVSSDFKGMGFLERLDLINTVVWKAGCRVPIEALPYTPEEFRERLEKSAVLRDARKYWVEIPPKEK